MENITYNSLAAGIIKRAIIDGDYKFFFSCFMGKDYNMPLDDYLDVLLSFAKRNKAECRKASIEHYIRKSEKKLEKDHLWNSPSLEAYAETINVNDEYIKYIDQKDKKIYIKIKTYYEIKAYLREMEQSVKDNYERIYSLKKQNQKEFEEELSKFNMNELERLALIDSTDFFKAQYADFVVYDFLSK